MPSLMVYETGNEMDTSSGALNTTIILRQSVSSEQARIVVGQAAPRSSYTLLHSAALSDTLLDVD